MLTFVSYAQLMKLFGKKIFVSGPHNDGELDLHNSKSFGHYNPLFVKWLRTNIRFLISRDNFRKSTEVLFHKYVNRLVAIYYASYHILRQNPNVCNQLSKNYLDRIASESLNPLHYWGISWVAKKESDDPVAKMMYQLKKVSRDPNTASSAIYFWIRRMEDGTADLFFSLIVDVFVAYNYDSYRIINKAVKWDVETDTSYRDFT